MQQLKTFEFHKGTIVPSTGNASNVGSASQLCLQFETAGTFQAVVQGSIDLVNYKDIGLCISLKSGDVAENGITDKSAIWSVGLNGLCGIRVNIVSTTAPITVLGRFVD